MIIHVKYNSNHPLAVDVSPMQDVAALKQEIADKYGLELSQIRIIFQGKELTDNVHLQDCDFGMHTVIHAVKGQRQQTSRSIPPDASQSAEENLVSLNPLPEEYRDQYFIYCKECHSMQNGRIRVRCKTCKEGAFTVDRDPGCWEDVLVNDRISGSCLSQGCRGNVADFFFKCKGHTGDVEGSSCVPLHHIRPNRRSVPCLACTDVLSPILVFPCENQHVICVDCFQAYCQSKLNDRAFISTEQHGYTLPCPGCDSGVIEEPHHFRLMGDEQYERYQRFGAEECLLEAGGVLCPTPGCGAGLLPDTNDRRVECVVQAGTGCGLVFCRQCLENYHAGACHQQPQNPTAASARSQIDAAQLERAQWDREARELIHSTTKQCPQCKVPTEKDGGCMHMTCTRCRFNWCWLCETEWNRTCQARHWFG